MSSDNRSKKLDEKKKSRYFAFIVYTDNPNLTYDLDFSPREKLIQILRSTHMDFAVSPVHQPDDEYISQHIHVIYYHGNSVSLKAVRQILIENLGLYTFYDDKPLIHNNFVLPVVSPSGYQRYLIHLDDLEKEQFDFENIPEENIYIIGLFPLDLTKELTKAEKMRLQREIESMIEEEKIYEYAFLCRYLRTNDSLQDHYEYLTTHTMHFCRFLDSLRNYNLLESKKKDSKEGRE